MAPNTQKSTDNIELKEHVHSFKDAHILVIGDIMLDRFIYGSVDRISPESPVPVLSIKREDYMLGGAGNALANIATLGAKGTILSVVGEDEEGSKVSNLIKKMGLSADGLLALSDRPTIVKTRYLAGHQQLLRTDFEKSVVINKAAQDTLLDKAKTFMKEADAVIISDYGKGLLSKDFIAELIKLAKKQKLPVIVDPKGFDFTIYKGATAITPNKKELSEATQGLPVESDEEVIEAAETLIKNCNLEAVIATRSAQGMTLVQKKEEPLHLDASALEVFDVSGAGDTVIATITTALAAGASFKDAVQLANIAGGIVVAKVGTAGIRQKELLEGLEQSSNATICDEIEAVEQIQKWKAKGLKTGFTNGCFDILHYGHVSYLNDARSRCDRLIVGLNTDFSIKQLKGPERPIHDEVSRAAVLAALSSVDMVVFFGAEEKGGDNTAIKLLRSLQPDLYFKGGDYTEDQIPEAPTVRDYGGDVCVMPIYEGHSTTASIEKSKRDSKAESEAA